MEWNSVYLDYGASHLLKASRIEYLQSNLVYETDQVVTSIRKEGLPLYINCWDILLAAHRWRLGHQNGSKIFRGSWHIFLLVEKENLRCKPHFSLKKVKPFQHVFLMIYMV